MIADAHLDLAMLAPQRDLTQPVPSGEQGPLVSFPDLLRGQVALCFATVYVHGYRSPAEAEAQGLAQLAQYRSWEQQGLIRILESRAGLQSHLASWDGRGPVGALLLLEGADPLPAPEALADWAAMGLRLIGPAWSATRYSGGTGAPGPLTDLGHALLEQIVRLGLILDVSHLSEEAFWQALAYQPKLVATHSNARALVPTDRQLSDAMLDAIAARDGRVGVVLFNRFLDPSWERGRPRLPRAAVGRQLRHLAARVGWGRLGIGSDFDGGFDRSATPLGLDSAADLGKLADLVPPEHRVGFLGRNWTDWLLENLA